MRRRCCKIGGLLLIGVLSLIFLLRKDEHVTHHVQLHAKQTEHKGSPVHTNSTSTWPVCQRNPSAANAAGFSSLPSHLQDFLYYRHCRHFPTLLDVPDKCGGADKSSDVFLLLVIKSSPGNRERRRALRETWAGERSRNGTSIRRIFLSGTAGSDPEKRRQNELLALEHREHGDVLQWDFEDTFFNLTLKQVLFLEWMARNCPRARFLLNGDDDVFAHTDNMVEYLQGTGNDGGRHLFVGHLIDNAGPIRYRGSKYFEESDSYPPYCGGGGYLLSGHTASVIYNTSKSIRLHPIDDVYMGMCLARAGLKPRSHIGVRTKTTGLPSKRIDSYDPCSYRRVLLVHRFQPHQLYVMWREVRDPELKCDITSFGL